MFGVALDLKIGNFKYLIQHPKLTLIGLSSQLIILPILTLGLIWLISPPTSLAMGMILVAGCPGGNVSNFAVHLSRANAALSVVLTSISTMSAVLITPLYFGLLSHFIEGGKAYRQAIFIEPADLAFAVFQLIVVPLILGMVVNHFLPVFSNKIKKGVRILSILIFLGFVVFAVAGNYQNIKKYLHLVFIIVLIHNTVALFSGYSWAKLFKLDKFNARAISIETGIQNSGLALIIIFNFFDGIGGMALIAAWWGIWHLLSAFGLSMLWRYKEDKVIAAT